MRATISRGSGRRARSRGADAYPPDRPMPQFRTKRRVAHSAGDMFDLVADMERYPEFVPLCQSLRVREHKSREDGVEIVLAQMTVAYRLVRETFTTRVTLDRANLTIGVEYLD